MTRFGYPAAAPAAEVVPPGPALASGTYIPFIGISSGIASNPPTVAHDTHWLQIGDIVQVTGWLEATPLQIGLDCEFSVALPVIPNPLFASTDRLSGVATALDPVQRVATGCAITARTAGNAQQARFLFEPTTLNRINFEYSFSYSVI